MDMNEGSAMTEGSGLVEDQDRLTASERRRERESKRFFPALRRTWLSSCGRGRSTRRCARSW
jgi:hypothetical protein